MLLTRATQDSSQPSENQAPDVEVYLPPCCLSNSDVLADVTQKLDHLPSAAAQDVRAIMKEFPSLFSDTLRECTVLRHDVDVRSAHPIRQPPYRLNREKKAFLESEIDRLLDQGIICRSPGSPWASPVVLVPKAGGSYRLCVDYRRVNKLTVPDSYPLPRIDDILDELGAAKYLSKFDLLSGYHQVALTEHTQAISAFITSKGLFEFKRMPFGLCNAPATFQRALNLITGHLQGVQVYLDDVVVYSHSWEEHVCRLHDLFTALDEAQLTINLAKSEFGHAEIRYLGHVVGQGCVAPIAAKTEAIANFPVPQSRKEVMRFLGLAGYYRRFCQNFSQIAVPLTELLKKGSSFTWTPACQTAFDHLRKLLSSDPVLRLPNFDSPFHLHIDACDTGVGAALLQPDGNSNILHPVAYYSYKLKDYQRGYSTYEKEALALVLALEKFSVYLSANPVYVKSDHNPLTFVNQVKNKNNRVLRWSLSLQKYNLHIEHISGRHNVIADTLSRVHDHRGR